MSAIALDPLIAEAKARARRRRLLALGVLVLAAAAIVTTFALRSSNGGAREGGAGPGTGQLGAPVAIYGFDVSKSKSRRFISAVGSSRLWLSANAGRTWHPLRVPGLGGPYPMSRYGGDDFIDLAHGWVVMYSSSGVRIDRTTDGGRTWRASYFRGGSPGEGFAFQTRLNGYLDIKVKGRDERFATRDGGATWTLRPSHSRLLGRRHALKLGYSTKPGVPGGALVETNDHGRHWTAVSLPDNPSLQFVTSFGRVVVVPAHVVGPCGDLGFYISDDGGSTWKLRCAPRRINPGIPQFNVSVASAASWYALSGGLTGQTTLWATHDEGRTWHVVPISGVHPAWGTEPIDFLDARLGWALGGRRGSTLVRTTDGGRHWIPAGPPRPKAHKRG